MSLEAPLYPLDTFCRNPLGTPCSSYERIGLDSVVASIITNDGPEPEHLSSGK